MYTFVTSCSNCMDMIRMQFGEYFFEIAEMFIEHRNLNFSHIFLMKHASCYRR